MSLERKVGGHYLSLFAISFSKSYLVESLWKMNSSADGVGSGVGVGGQVEV